MKKLQIIKTNSKITKGTETKNKIYHTAIKLFEEQGIDNVSITNIVKEAGISKGAFYVHYKSKFSLIREYVHSLDLNYEEYFKSIPEDTTPSDMIILVTKKTSEVLRKDIGYNLIKNIYQAMLIPEFEQDAKLNYNRSLPSIYKEIILRGITNGEFKSSIDVENVAQQFIMSIRGMTFEWCVHSGDFDLENELLNHVNLLLEGLKL